MSEEPEISKALLAYEEKAFQNGFFLGVLACMAVVLIMQAIIGLICYAAVINSH